MSPEKIFKNKRNKDFNLSQNISPKNYNIIEDRKFNSVYEDKKKIRNVLINNRYNYFTSKNLTKGDDKTYPEKNTIKLQNLKIGLLPYNRFSKSQLKYNNFSNKNNMTMIDTPHKDNLLVEDYIPNSKFFITESIHKINISTDLHFNNSLNPVSINNITHSNYKKISYILNSNTIKNKSITYFNIRVVNNQVQENLNKVNKNNAFYFSKYSRYNHN